ncbi:MAG: methyltransferase, partial [Desulfobacterales bacterium]|nr:methyltransferase [Desulfobacterales bacterium]
MRNRTLNLDAPHFRILTNEKIKKIVQAALSCLERTGIDVLNAEGVDLLKSAGARVDGKRVRIPARVIEDALETTPESFTLYGEEERFNIRV